MLTNRHGRAVSVAWTDVSTTMLDVPATEVLRIGNKLAVGTDYPPPPGRGIWTLSMASHVRRCDGN